MLCVGFSEKLKTFAVQERAINELRVFFNALEQLNFLQKRDLALPNFKCPSLEKYYRYRKFRRPIFELNLLICVLDVVPPRLSKHIWADNVRKNIQDLLFLVPHRTKIFPSTFKYPMKLKFGRPKGLSQL